MTAFWPFQRESCASNRASIYFVEANRVALKKLGEPIKWLDKME